jgi:hypothetical protein
VVKMKARWVATRPQDMPPPGPSDSAAAPVVTQESTVRAAAARRAALEHQHPFPDVSTGLAGSVLLTRVIARPDERSGSPGGGGAGAHHSSEARGGSSGEAGPAGRGRRQLHLQQQAEEAHAASPATTTTASTSPTSSHASPSSTSLLSQTLRTARKLLGSILSPRIFPDSFSGGVHQGQTLGQHGGSADVVVGQPQGEPTEDLWVIGEINGIYVSRSDLHMTMRAV